MLPVNGFFGHIQKNHFRSLIMFMGFMVSMHITIATIMSIPLPMWRHIPAIFSDPIAYFKAMGVMATAIGVIIFILFYYVQSYLLKWTIGFKPLSVNHCQRAHKITQELATIAGIPVPQLDYIPTPALNSFASGLSKNNAHIIVTQGLLEALDDDELAAVIAHEIAHIKNGDMNMMAVANAAIGSIQSINFINPMKMTLFKHIPPIFFILGFPILVPLFILVVFYSFVMQLTSLITSVTAYVISSSREYIADAEAVGLTHNPAALVSALSKIHGRSNLHCKNIIASSMMIDGPASGKNASHPPMQMRIEKLTQLSGSMIHGTGVRKDTRQRSLKANHGSAYGAASYANGKAAPSFAQSFGYNTHVAPTNVSEYIPTSADYAAYQGRTFKQEESGSLLDRITFGNDAEFGLDQTARWALIAVLSIFVISKVKIRLQKQDPVMAEFIAPAPADRTPVFVTFDLNNDGLVTINQNRSDVSFDIHNDGQQHAIGWLAPREGFLFHDVNRNGQMDGMSELVTLDYRAALSAKSFQMLKQFDSNSDGVVNGKDNEFSHLMIWRDLDSNGKFKTYEGYTLDQLGIKSLVLRATKFGTSEGWLTQDSNTQLLRKGRYVHDHERALKPIGDMAGGRIYMTSFEVNLYSAKTPNNIARVQTSSHSTTNGQSSAETKLTAKTAPPALRLRR